MTRGIGTSDSVVADFQLSTPSSIGMLTSAQSSGMSRLRSWSVRVSAYAFLLATDRCPPFSVRP